QTAGRSKVPSGRRSLGSHSWPHRHRHPSSLTSPISASFCLPIATPSLAAVYTGGIDRSTTLRYLLWVDTDWRVGDGRTAATGTRDRGDRADSAREGRARLHRSQPEHAGGIHRGHGAAPLLLPRLRTAQAALQAPLRR